MVVDSHVVVGGRLLNKDEYPEKCIALGGRLHKLRIETTRALHIRQLVHSERDIYCGFLIAGIIDPVPTGLFTTEKAPSANQESFALSTFFCRVGSTNSTP